MIIQHNMTELFINKQLKKTNGKKSTSAERLASGYKLNRSADDAANMIISEKMRGQIRGLDQASINIQDGISLVQTAEGALNEIHSILQRLRELSVQSANGTNTNSDRNMIQKEVNQLLDEIDQIADETEFNEIKVLKGGETLISNNSGTAIGGLPSWVTRTNDGYLSDTITTTYTLQTVIANGIKVSEKYIYNNGSQAPGTTDYERTGSNTIEERVNGTLTNSYTVAGFSSNPLASYLTTIGDTVSQTITETNIDHSGTELDFSNLNSSNIKQLVNKKKPQGFYSTCCTCSQRYSINFVNNKGSGSTVSNSGSHYIYNVDISSLLSKQNVTGEDLAKLVISELTATGYGKDVKTQDGLFSYGFQLQNHYTAITSNGNKLIMYDARPNSNLQPNAPIQTLHGFGDYAHASPQRGLFGVGVFYSNETIINQEKLHIQAGANSHQDIKLPWPNISAKRLGVETITTLIGAGESTAIEIVDDAVSNISKHRNRYGAYQNRLEYAEKNADNTYENLQMSESRIRDADLSKEVINNSKQQTLEQTSIALLAQNKNNKNIILSLLQ